MKSEMILKPNYCLTRVEKNIEKCGHNCLSVSACVGFV